MSERVILHSDCNGFYASVECLHNPKIRSKPVAVSGDAENRHGIILAKNELAKKYHVKTGEAIWQAKQKCPELVTVPPHFDLYRRFSRLCKEIYFDYTDRVESFGLDEAWLDVTGSSMLFGSGYEIAQRIRKRIKYELGITVSIGVSFNKIFAKLGSDYKKPDAVTVISRENFKNIVWELDCGDLLYVGSATKKRLHTMGIYTIGDIAKCPIEILRKHFGKHGDMLYAFANGYDVSPVAKLDLHDPVKSIGNSTTTPRDLVDFQDVKTVMCVLCDSVCRRMREQGFIAGTVSISVRDNTLQCFSRQRKLESATSVTDEILKAALKLFRDSYSFQKPLRSVGISVFDLLPENSPRQTDLFGNEKIRQRQESLDSALDRLKNRFGNYSIFPALLLQDKGLSHFNPKDEHTIHPVSFFR